MRILVAVVPMAGHVGPVSGLVAELVRRGHDVRVYTGSRYRQRFADLGARVVTWSAARDFDEDDLALSFPLARRSPALTQVALVRDGFIGTAPGQVRDLGLELQREPADVLVVDSMGFGGALTGELHGLPWAVLNVLPFNQSLESGTPPGFRVPPAAGVLGRQRDRLLRQVYRIVASPFDRAYQRARMEVGLPPDRRPYGSLLISDWLVLATGCPSLDLPRPDLPPLVHFVGRLEPAGTAGPAPVVDAARSRPLVLVTQGTHDVDPAVLTRPALAGLADLEVDVIATTGRRNVTDVGVVPPANACVVDLIDFATVLPTAAVFVSNGGWGGVLASLAAGVPLVVAPGRAADKPEVAARVARSGTGVNLRRGHPAPGAIADAVRQVLGDGTYAERARLLGSELRQLGGAPAAVDLLERLAETRRPIARTGNTRLN